MCLCCTGGKLLTGKAEVRGGKVFRAYFLYHNPTWSSMGSNPVLRDRLNKTKRKLAYIWTGALCTHQHNKNLQTTKILNIALKVTREVNNFKFPRCN